MILSFHPMFVGNENILCAGRDPGPEELATIKSADAVVLPQGCPFPLYDMARQHCANVFPNYDARFRYPGKTGQAELFKARNVPHPASMVFQNTRDFYDRYDNAKKRPFEFPFVFKFSWGGEGDTVFLIDSPQAFLAVLQKAVDFEQPDAQGFLIQKYITTDHKSLRVAVIGKKIVSYWRIQNSNKNFYTSVSKGAEIDAESDPHLQNKAKTSIKDFCRRTGINLAGFDLLFSKEDIAHTPQFLEINYYFGREGLGGSFVFYQMLEAEIIGWLKDIGLSLTK
jgi:ribosomal protein S6--L-glutamate ligase